MSTYYKYVDRDVNQQINWADVGGQISKSLLDRQADLAKQKAAINKDSTELLNQLNNPELGTNRDINTLMIDGGMKLAQTQKSLNTLFNKRLLSQSEYLQATQNIKTNADTFSKLAKQWNESSAAGHQAITDGKASLATASILGYVEGIFNPNTIATVVDDKGNLFLGSKVVKNIDGVDVISVDAKPGALQSVNNYSALLKTGIVPKYDIEKFAKSFEVEKQKYIKILAEKDPTVYQRGEQFIIDDLKRNPNFMSALLDATSAASTSPLSTVSILFDGAGSVDGKPYEVDFSDKKEGENIIKARVTPTGIEYDLTDSQKAKAQDVLLQRVLGKISVEEKKNIIDQSRDASLPWAQLGEEKRQFNIKMAEKEEEKRKEEQINEDNLSSLAEAGANFLNPKTNAELNSAIDSIQKIGKFRVKVGSDKSGKYKAFLNSKGDEISKIYDRGQSNKSRVNAVVNLYRASLGNKSGLNYKELGEKIEAKLDENIQSNLRKNKSMRGF